MAALEVATRLTFSDIGTTGDNTSYFARRWHAANPPQRNALGFRERDFAAVPSPEVYRIAVVGDSFVYGQGILECERLSNRLERHLNESASSFEVLNFGEPGADYAQNATNAEIAITQSHPDFVLLSWYQNDVVDPDGSRLRPYRLGWRLHSWLNPHSALYFLINDAFTRLQLAASSAGHGALLLEHSRQTEERLGRLLEVPRRHHLPSAMILWRHPSEAGIDLAESAGLVDRVLAVCRQYEVTCLDLGPALAPHAAGDRLIVSRFDGHPDAWANALAAEAVLSTFGPQWQAAAAAKRTPAVSAN